jgi:hypothetical protein
MCPPAVQGLWLSCVLTVRTPLWCFRREDYPTNQKQFLKRVPGRFTPDHPTNVSMWGVPWCLLLQNRCA